MNTKERFDACIKLSEYGVKNFSERRKYEWKIALAFWALLVGAITFLKLNPMPEVKHNVFMELSLFTVIVLVFGFSFLWLRGIWVANKNDKSIAHEFFSAAHKILCDPNHIPPPVPEKLRVCDWR